MTSLLRFLQSTDARLVLAVCVGVLLVTMAPHGILTGNEEQYLAEAFRSVRPDAWPAASNMLGGFPHAIVFNTLMGKAIDVLGFPLAQALGRSAAIALYAVALTRLCRQLDLTVGDILIVLVAFLVAGEGLVGNEWMFRGIEPKVPAYGLVLLALTELLRERPGRCFAWLVTASYLHAFVGGFWAIIFTVALLARRETRLRAIIAGALALVAMMPFLFYLLDNGYGQLNAPSTPSEGPSIGWILSYVAFPWHTTPFVDGRTLIRWMPGIFGTVLITVLAILVRLRADSRMTRTLAALAFIAGVWVLSALALTWYFHDGRLGAFVPFRPSGMGLLIALLVMVLLIKQLAADAAQWLRLGLLAALLAASLPVVLQIYVYPPGRDVLRVAQQREFVDWVRRNTPPDSVFLIDPWVEEAYFDFERRTGRASFFVHRFTPGMESDIRTWYRRYQFQESFFLKGCASSAPPSKVDYVVFENPRANLVVPECGKVVFEGNGVSVVRMGVKGD